MTRTSKSFRTQSDLAAAAGVTEVTIRNSNPGIKEKKLPQNNSIARPTAESKSIFK
ncbi:MAG: hypothetical protein WBE34_08765 [Candidatus Nitrosopolaris sp.]